MKFSLAIHVLGLAMWLPGLMVVTGIMKYFVRANRMQDEAAKALVVRYWKGMVLPGAGLSIASGLYQLFYNGPKFYFSQGWFHGKVTLVIILLGVTFFTSLLVKDAVKGETVSLGCSLFLHAASGALLVLIVCLTLIGRP